MPTGIWSEVTVGSTQRTIARGDKSLEKSHWIRMREEEGTTCKKEEEDRQADSDFQTADYRELAKETDGSRLQDCHEGFGCSRREAQTPKRINPRDS